MTDIAQRIAALSPEQRAALQQRLKKRQQDAAAEIPVQDRSAGTFPLSFAQERLWLHYQLDPDSSLYNLPTAARQRGDLDPAIIEQVFNQIIQRHESLRTVFFNQDGVPMQRVLPHCPLTIQVHNLRELPADEREAALRRLMDEEARRPFDLAHGPLLRVALVQLPGESVLITNLHHIAADDWSAGVLVREKLALYAARAEGRDAALPDLPVQYADFAVWQRERLAGSALEQQLAYWQGQLGGPLPVIELPTDRPRPAVQTSRGGRVSVSIPGTLLGDLKALGRAEGTTLFMTTLAAFAVLLQRYSGQDDLLIGTPITSRSRAELEGVMGCFINMLVLRLDLSGQPSFRELLARVRKTALEAYANPDVPFEKLLEVLRPPRDASRSPIFQVGFQVQDPMELRKQLPDTVIAYEEIDDGTSQFDLGLQIAEEDDAIVTSLLFNADLFDAATTERMLGHLGVLLAAAVADPDQPIARLPLLPDAERALLERWSRSTSPFPTDVCVHQLFAQQAARTPGAVAVVYEDQRLTYRELDERANRVAHLLRARGVTAESLVGLCVERSLDLVVGMLGVWKAGAAYVPLDPGYPPERLAFMLEDAGVAALLTQAPLLERLPAHAAGAICFDRDSAALAAQPATPPAEGAAPEQLAYLIYTSGTTGTPKAVTVEHRNLANVLFASREAFGFDAADIAPCLAPFPFDIFLFELWNPLVTGGRAVLLSHEHVLDLPRLVEDLTEVTAVHAVPSLMQQIVNWIDDHGIDPARFDRMRKVFTGGDAVPPALLDALRRVFRRAQTFVLYGPTEATIICSRYPVPAEGELTRRLIGTPLANTLLHVCDRFGNPAPIGVPGELYIGGAGVARGYLRRDELTAEKFVVSSFGAEGAGDWGLPTGGEHQEPVGTTDASGNSKLKTQNSKFYRSGDLARWLPDGTLEFLGRIDGQVKIRGHRVELGEIETVARQHPGVRDVAVVAHDDPAGGKRLVAYVVADNAQPELWPSIGEYFVYDELIYYGLTNDERRNQKYKEAMERLVRDKVVVDIGTGRDAIQARLCVEAGARRVYAIEILEESYRHARRTVRELGLEDRITVIHGNAMEVELPEPADVCVSEIVEAIAGAEGSAPILNSVRRLLRPDGVFIPNRNLTKVAAVTLPDELVESPLFSKVAGSYVQKIFDQVGHPFDVRLCVKNFPKANLLTDVQIFEDQDFTNVAVPAVEEYRHEVRFQVERAGRMDGFLLWLYLQLDDQSDLDILDEPYSWFPVYFPIFHPGVTVAPGDTIEAVCEARLCDNRINPDYRISGRLIRAGGEVVPFDYESVHHQRQYRATPFYAHLFRGEALPVEEGSRQAGLAKQLRGFLTERLPGYMVPSAVVTMDALPVTRNGKVDRKALPDPGRADTGDEAGYVAPRSEVEATLARIWAEALNRETVGIHDNFFELGGDSILSLQIVSKASQAGIQFTSKQLFDRQTIANLVEVAEQAQTTWGEQGPVTGPVVLTPVQRRFFEQRLTAPQHFNQSMVLHVAAALQAEPLAEAIGQLFAHHDALRMRYTRTAEGWQQEGQTALPDAPLTVVDLREVPPAEREARFAEQAAAIQRSLDLQDGPVARFALFEAGPDAPRRLLVVVHHLVMDGVSWHTLLADLQAGYEQSARGQRIALPPKTTSFQAWAAELAAYARSAQLREQMPFWLEQAGHPGAALPVDLPGRTATFGAARRHTVLLDAEETRRLVNEIPTVYHARVDQIVLAAAARALSAWAGWTELLIDLEGHGREEDIVPGVSLARTVGWFTSVYPVRLDLAGAATPEATLRRIKEQLRAVPQGGIGYGLLRYAGDPDLAARLAALPAAEIGFNYLGQFGGQGQAKATAFQIGPDDAGPLCDPAGERAHLLDIDALIVNGQLHIQWQYSAAHFLPATVERWGNDCLAALRALINRSAEPVETTYVPSDFPMAQLNNDKLAAILKKVR
ncbi:MAG TPA: amino acid adenylation domain-containing protein [Roseiflexaceae bacterium]|nr:amino acid adenylation domain-containing protein [Roseiflexaceae bacterium]